ncbi:MAG TPA: SDR family NAD(P)-dependent oxidoreductase, partial [Candidatus Binataceae bacterium]|nr:SDR family NAD(P)-dependent oxidoreductase [Candidatus Binataceae bacterium]
MPSFDNQVVLITGAGSGIGRQLALTLAGEGAAIGAVDLSMEPLAKLAAEVPHAKVAWAVADVTDRPALRAAAARIQERLGPVDLLIASAGIGRETSALALNAEDIEAQIRVNLIGVANSIEAVLPGMLERRRGHLAAISSLASVRGFPGLAGYCASKAGVNALMDAFRLELKPLGIHVTTICPGWIRTPLTANVDVPPGELMEVGEAARRILKAIRQRKVFYAFPPLLARQLGLLGMLPCRISDWITVHLLKRVAQKTV